MYDGVIWNLQLLRFLCLRKTNFATPSGQFFARYHSLVIDLWIDWGPKTSKVLLSFLSENACYMFNIWFEILNIRLKLPQICSIWRSKITLLDEKDAPFNSFRNSPSHNCVTSLRISDFPLWANLLGFNFKFGSISNPITPKCLDPCPACGWGNSHIKSDHGNRATFFGSNLNTYVDWVTLFWIFNSCTGTLADLISGN